MKAGKIGDPEIYPSAFRIISLVWRHPKGVPRFVSRHLIVKGLASADGDVKVFLKAFFGYDPQEAECDIASGRPAAFF